MMLSLATDRMALPPASSFQISAAPSNDSPRAGFGYRIGASSFSPATIIGGGQTPSVFVIYNANGRLQGGGVAGPNPRIALPSVDAGVGIPRSLLYQRLGRSIYQITLAGQNGGFPTAYTLGYQLLV